MLVLVFGISEMFYQHTYLNIAPNCMLAAYDAQVGAIKKYL